MATKLTIDNVTNIFQDCLLENGSSEKGILVECISASVPLKVSKIEAHKAEIEEMLNCLPDDFKSSKAGGASFLQACVDNEGTQWTGMHHLMEKLFLLGMAIEKVRYVLPMKIWKNLPGGFPYLVYDDIPVKRPTEKEEMQLHHDLFVTQAKEGRLDPKNMGQYELAMRRERDGLVDPLPEIEPQ